MLDGAVTAEADLPAVAACVGAAWLVGDVPVAPLQVLELDRTGWALVVDAIVSAVAVIESPPWRRAKYSEVPRPRGPKSRPILY